MSNLIDRKTLLNVRKRYTKITGNVLHSLQHRVVNAGTLQDWYIKHCNFTQDLSNCIDALNPIDDIHKAGILAHAEALVRLVFTDGQVDANYDLMLNEQLLDLQGSVRALLSNLTHSHLTHLSDTDAERKLQLKSQKKLDALCDQDRNLLNILNSIIAQLHEWMDDAEQVANILIMRDSFAAYSHLHIKYQPVDGNQTKLHSYTDWFSDTVTVLDRNGSYKIGESQRTVSLTTTNRGGIIAKSVLFEPVYNIGDNLKLILQGNLDELRILCNQGLNIIDRSFDFKRDITCIDKIRLAQDNGFFLAMLNMQYDISLVTEDPNLMSDRYDYHNQYLVYKNPSCCKKILYYVDQSGKVRELGEYNLTKYFSNCDLDNQNKVLFKTFSEFKRFKNIATKTLRDDFCAQPKIVPNKNILQTLAKQKDKGLLNQKQYIRLKKIFAEVELANQYKCSNNKSWITFSAKSRAT